MWSSEVSWRRDEAHGFVNDGEYSFRNPDSHWGKQWVERNGFAVFGTFMRDAVGMPGS
jgi:hypothetical protein